MMAFCEMGKAIKKTRKKKGKKGVVAGGSAPGGGINFQAAVTALVEVHAAVGAKLGWLVGIAHDVPVAVSAETGGPGDDIGIQFEDGTRAEVQVKRGLSAESKMWKAVMKLAKAVNDGTVQYGVLVVCPNSSGTVRNALARDLERLAGGRADGLKPVTNTLVKKLEDAGLSVDKVAKRLRIFTSSCLVNDSDSINVAKARLATICANTAEAERAWNALYLDGARLIDFRGARAAESIVQVLRSEGIALRADSQAPGPLLASLCLWTARTNSSFSIPGIAQPLPMDEAWIELDALVLSEGRKAPSGLAEALEQYHSWAQGGSRRADDIVKAQTLGRFMRRGVLVGGPGMGKSTVLKKLAQTYAAEGFPVLLFSAKAIAQRMWSTGCSFEEGIIALGTDGSGLPISPQTLRSAAQWVLLCDALDEAGSDQQIVAEGLLKFAAGYPSARIVATTRPIGYSSSLLRSWRHYELQPLGSEHVMEHVERLVRAAGTSRDAQDKAVAFAKAQIDRNENARIAARSPLILGLISALAVQGVPLGDTKTQLYEQLFRQMEAARGRRDHDGGVLNAVLGMFLDILAWEILRDPTASVSDLHARCGDHLAEALSEPPLKARAMAEKCFVHWEHVGMIEKINHAGIEAATFIHKTFGEYAAARYLANMSSEDARKEIDANIDAKSWSEVLVFASSLGLVDAVLESRIGKKERLTYEVLAEALSMIVDSEVPPALRLRNKVFEAATQYLRSPIAREAVSIGNRLIQVGAKFPEEVVAATAALTASEQPWTRMAAWAAMSFARPGSYDLAGLRNLVSELPTLSATVSSKSFGRGIFDLDAWPTKQIDALFAFAIRETLKRLPSEEADALLLPILTPSYHGSFSGHMELLKILRECQRLDLAELMERPVKEQWRKMAEGLSFDGFDATILLANALKLQLPNTGPCEPLKENTTFWQLSGFLAATSFWEQPFRDMWPEKIGHDDDVIQETIRGCVIASGVDPVVLSKDIAMALREHEVANEERFSHILFQHTEHIDIEMEWRRATGMDIGRLELALHYSSGWVVQSAANLLAVNANPEELASVVRRVFEKGSGNALWAASQLCTLLKEPIKSELFLERLEMPLEPGCQHLYGALTALSLPLDERLLRVLRTGLLTFGPRTAKAATEVAEKYVDGNSEIVLLLQEAFDLWCSKEDPYPVGGGVIPESPREGILKVLLKHKDFDKLRLLRYVTDVRSHVTEVASDALFHALEAGVLREEFLAGVRKGDLPPNLLASALRRRVPFTEPQVKTICTFMSRPATDLRQAAMLVLKHGYLSEVEVQERVRALLADPDPEIRERARRLVGDER